MYCIGIWATAAERASNRPTTTASSSYGRGYQGVQFVSGGIKTGSKIEKKQPSKRELKKKPALIESYDSDEDSDEKQDDDYDDDDEVQYLGKKRKRRGQIIEDDDDDDDDEEEKDDDDKDSDIEEMQDDNNQQAGSSDEESNRPIIQRQPPDVQYRRPTPTNTAPVYDKEFGTFEKHTKGIGSKLMKKMGFVEGRGLGKNLQGRALPIQVTKRQGKGAIGRYGNEDPNRVKPAAGIKHFFSNYSNSFYLYLESEPSESKGSSKKNAGQSAPQWRKQQREVRSSKIIFRIFSSFYLESTKRTLCLQNIE